MKIKYRTGFHMPAKFATESVAEYVAGRALDTEYRGELETLADGQRKAAKTLGKLVEVLADKGLLNLEDVLEIAGSGYSDSKHELVKD